MAALALRLAIFAAGVWLLGGCATAGCEEHAAHLRERHSQVVLWCQR